MFKKLTSSPKIFLTLAFISLIIVFGLFFYLKTQLAGAKAAYWQFKWQALLNLPTKFQTADPLITQGNNPTKQPTVPSVGANDAKWGNPEAKVTIFEFADFTCAYCAEVQPILKQIEDAYKNQVQIIWQDFPLTAKPEALQAARAAQCARWQTKSGDQFWAYHDLLFANQNQLNYDNYLKWAKQLKLDKDTFANCLANNQEVNAQILANIEQGNNLGISGVPTFYVNDKVLTGAVTFEDFQKIIEEELVEQS